MLDLTQTAREELKRVGEERRLEPGRLLRLAVPPVWTGDGEWGIVIDQRGAADIAYAHEGSTVLVVEAEVAEALANAILDFKRDEPPGPRFTLDVY